MEAHLSDDPVRAWTWRRRVGALKVAVAVAVVGWVGWRLATHRSAPTVTPVDVPAAPAPRVDRFGDPTAAAAAFPDLPAADTGALGDPAVLDGIDAVRGTGAWCGVPVPALADDDRLTATAVAQAAWLASSGVRAHRTPGSPVGTTVADRAANHGYHGPVGEVLAWGGDDGARAVAWWTRSRTHCPVLLDPSWTRVGAAWHDGVWVVVFGG